MAIFGNKEAEELSVKVAKLQKDNENLKSQLVEYEKIFGNFEDMKRVTDRVREENKRLLEKLEESVEVKGKMQANIDELNDILNSKKEEIQLKIFAMVSNDDNIVVGDNVEFTGGLNTPKNISTGKKVIIRGDVKAGEKVTIGDDNHIRGIIDSEQGVSTGKNCKVEGGIFTRGSVEIGESCVISEVVADADVNVDRNANVKKIVSGKNVTLGDGVSISEGIEYNGTITMGKDVKISGEIKTRS
ncbi:MAG: GAS domain-containing protein [Candidatus Methanofastidiosia archaeon]